MNMVMVLNMVINMEIIIAIASLFSAVAFLKKVFSMIMSNVHLVAFHLSKFPLVAIS